LPFGVAGSQIRASLHLSSGNTERQDVLHTLEEAALVGSHGAVLAGVIHGVPFFWGA